MRRNFAVSWGDTRVVPFSFRFRLRSLLVRMCALKALPRLNLPVAVFLKRLAAPRWLFSLGMFLRSFAFLRGFAVLRGRGLRLLGPGLLRQDRVHLVAFLPRHRFRHRQFRKIV